MRIVNKKTSKSNEMILRREIEGRDNKKLNSMELKKKSKIERKVKIKIRLVDK